MFPLILVAAVALASRGGAMEQLVFEDFEKFDLKQLGATWELGGGGDFSIVDEPGHGKVLKVNAKGGGWPSLTVKFDAAKVRGHVIRIAASAKFPGTFMAVPDKVWARPKLLLTFKDKNGKDQYCEAPPEAGKPDWQNLVNHTTIDPECQSVVGVSVRIDLVAAEVFFDDFSVEMDPDLNTQPKKSAPGGTATAGGTQSTPAANLTPAQKAPKRTLEDGGALFGPEIAAALQKAIKPGTANTYAVLGPGLPVAGLDSGKVPDKWTRIPNSKELVGSAAAPRALLTALPEFLAKNKPEILFLVGEGTLTRKTTMLESLDWEDLARVCLRMGVIPVFAVPPAAPNKEGPVGMAEDLRTSMVKAATDANCPAIDMKTAQLIPRLVKQMISALDMHVFCRTPIEAAGTKKPGVEDE